MTTHPARWIPALALAVGLAATADRHPARAADPAEDPLPKGAKLRLGSARLAFRFGPAFIPIPLDYKTLAFADGRDKLRRYDLATGKFVGPENDAKGPLTGTGGQMVMSADGKRYIVHRTGIVTIRDVATGEPVKEIRRPDGFSTTFAGGQPTVALSADGKVFAQGSMDKERRGDVTVWDAEKAEILFHTNTLQSAPALPTLSADGKLLATRGYGGFNPAPGKDPEDNPNRILQVWDLAGKKELFQAKLTNVGGFQSSAVFSPDASLLAASAGDGVIDWWDVKTGKARPALLGRTGQGQRLTFSPDGKSLAAVGNDGSIQRWSVADGKPLDTTEAPDGSPMFQPQGLAFAGNERVLAWGLAGSAAVVWEAPSGKLLTPPQEHTGPIWSIGFAAGGKEVVTSASDGRTVRWDAATGKPLGPLNLRPPRGATYPVRHTLTLSPDGTRAFSTTASAVFDLKTGGEEFAVPRNPFLPGGYTTHTSVTRDVSKAVVTVIPYDQKKTGKAVAWDLTTRQKLGEVELEGVWGTGYPPAVTVSPSGARLVTAAYAPVMPGMAVAPGGGPPLVITGWDLKTGKKLGQFEDLDARGQIAVAAASESYAVVAAQNNRLRAYDYESGRGGEIFDAGQQNRFDSSVGQLVFSPDGKRFVAAVPGDEQGTFGVRIHSWPTGNVQQTLIGHSAPVTAITFSPDGKTLATGSQDTTVLLWELKDEK